MSKAIDIAKQMEYINSRFSEGARLTVQELSAEMEAQGFEHVSDKTLYRRLSEMKAKEGKYESDSEGRWYSTSGQTVLMPSFITSMDNVKYINIIQNMVDSLKGTAVHDKVAKLFDELARVSKVPTSASSRVIFMGAPACEVKDEVWKTIFTAMEKNNYISFGYSVASKHCDTHTSVIPLQLIFDNGIWDLWALDCKSNTKKLYNVGRIKDITIKKETFTLPEDFDFYKETPGTFGCFRDVPGTGPGMTTYSIFLKNGSYVQTYVLERRWGPNQSVEDVPGGKVLKFQGNQFKPVLRWLLGWGADVQPLAPASLVDEWTDTIRRMSELL